MIVEKISRPAASVIEAYRALLEHDSVTCAISDCLGRFGAMTADMRPLFEGLRIAPGDIVVVDENGVVVVPGERSSEILEKTRRMLATEHLLQNRIRAGATIGQLVDIDRVFAGTFDYQDQAVGTKR